MAPKASTPMVSSTHPGAVVHPAYQAAIGPMTLSNQQVAERRQKYGAVFESLRQELDKVVEFAARRPEELYIVNTINALLALLPKVNMVEWTYENITHGLGQENAFALSNKEQIDSLVKEYGDGNGKAPLSMNRQGRPHTAAETCMLHRINHSQGLCCKLVVAPAPAPQNQRVKAIQGSQRPAAKQPVSHAPSLPNQHAATQPQPSQPVSQQEQSHQSSATFIRTQTKSNILPSAAGADTTAHMTASQQMPPLTLRTDNEMRGPTSSTMPAAGNGQIRTPPQEPAATLSQLPIAPHIAGTKRRSTEEDDDLLIVENPDRSIFKKSKKNSQPIFPSPESESSVLSGTPPTSQSSIATTPSKKVQNTSANAFLYTSAGTPAPMSMVPSHLMPGQVPSAGNFQPPATSNMPFTVPQSNPQHHMGSQTGSRAPSRASFQSNMNSPHMQPGSPMPAQMVQPTPHRPSQSMTKFGQVNQRVSMSPAPNVNGGYVGTPVQHATPATLINNGGQRRMSRQPTPMEMQQLQAYLMAQARGGTPQSQISRTPNQQMSQQQMMQVMQQRALLLQAQQGSQNARAQQHARQLQANAGPQMVSPMPNHTQLGSVTHAKGSTSKSQASSATQEQIAAWHAKHNEQKRSQQEQLARQHLIAQQNLKARSKAQSGKKNHQQQVPNKQKTPRHVQQSQGQQGQQHMHPFPNAQQAQAVHSSDVLQQPQHMLQPQYMENLLAIQNNQNRQHPQLAQSIQQEQFIDPSMIMQRNQPTQLTPTMQPTPAMQRTLGMQHAPAMQQGQAGQNMQDVQAVQRNHATQHAQMSQQVTAMQHVHMVQQTSNMQHTEVVQRTTSTQHAEVAQQNQTVQPTEALIHERPPTSGQMMAEMASEVPDQRSNLQIDHAQAGLTPHSVLNTDSSISAPEPNPPAPEATASNKQADALFTSPTPIAQQAPIEHADTQHSTVSVLEASASNGNANAASGAAQSTSPASVAESSFVAISTPSQTQTPAGTGTAKTPSKPAELGPFQYRLINGKILTAPNSMLLSNGTVKAKNGQIFSVRDYLTMLHKWVVGKKWPGLHANQKGVNKAWDRLVELSHQRKSTSPKEM